jgi:hypothetical protein
MAVSIVRNRDIRAGPPFELSTHFPTAQHGRKGRSEPLLRAIGVMMVVMMMVMTGMNDNDNLSRQR